MTDVTSAAAVQGSCDPRFAALSDILGANVASDADLGASVAVMLDGDLVVDIWAGHLDHERTVPWERDTITNVWSSTKTVMALCALLLVERGELDVDAPVASYWPEFAANGKEGILVRQILSHTSGVSGWDQPVVIEDLYDWEKSTAMLAAQAPWWTPGTPSGYHALNQGHLVGEVIRRITGRKLGEFLADELAGPLGADFHIGLPDAEFARVADVVPPPPLPIDFDSLTPDMVVVKTFTGPAPRAEDSWTPEWRRADMGALNGHGNARSIALLQSIISNDGVAGGRQFLSPGTIDQIFRVQSDGVDQVLGMPVRFGIGYGLPCESTPHLPADRPICYWSGWGGSTVVNVVDRNMTVAYMMNRMAPGLSADVRGAAIVSAALAAVDA